MSATCGMRASILRLTRLYNPHRSVLSWPQLSASPTPSRPSVFRRAGRDALVPAAIAAGVALSLAAFAAGYARTAPARGATTVRASISGRYRDGTFTGWARSPHGRILATVVIRRGRIAS